MKRLILLVLTGISLSTAAQQPNQAVCATPPEITAALSAAQEKYKKRFDELSESTKASAKKIEDETPKSGPEAAIGFTGHIESRKTEWILDVPQVSMKEQKMVIGLPQVTMRTQAFSFDNPVVVTGQECHKGPDEVVCEWTNDGAFGTPSLTCRTRPGADICLPTVKVEMRREEFKTDVPEVKMADEEWLIKVPEFSSGQVKIAFDYPVLIVDDIKAKTAEQKKKASDLANSTKETAAQLSTSMRAELKGLTKAQIDSAFSCQTQQVRTNIRYAYDKLNQMLQSTAAGLQKAKELKATDAEAAYQKALDQLNDSRKKLVSNYIVIRKEMAAKKAQALAAIPD